MDCAAVDVEIESVSTFFETNIPISQMICEQFCHHFMPCFEILEVHSATP